MYTAVLLISLKPLNKVTALSITTKSSQTCRLRTNTVELILLQSAVFVLWSLCFSEVIICTDSNLVFSAFLPILFSRLNFDLTH